ncbi:MAG: glycosyltransferase [Gemmatimonadaceae bacterium]
MADPILSVVVPAHNASPQLALALNALNASDLSRELWELIVVDDGSGDDTAVVAGTFADRVASTGTRARGPAYARNRGAEIASAQLIAFIDADVVVHGDTLSLLVRAVDRDENIVAAFGSYDDTPAGAGTVSEYRNLLHHYVHQQNAGDASTFWAGCGIVDARAFRDVGMFDEKSYPKPQIEDIELGRRLIAAGGRVIIDPRIQVKHLKAWRIPGMLKTDLVDRGVPWVRLLLKSPAVGKASTPSLGAREIIGSVAVAGSLAFAVAGVVLPWTFAFFLSAALLALSLWVNRKLYRWFARVRTPGFMLRVIPLHILYQLVSIVAVPIGALLHFRDRFSRAAAMYSGGAGTSVGRFLPLASGEVAARVVAFVATAYLARRLGASGFGAVAFAAALVAQFGIAIAAGIGEIGAREVARDPLGVRRITAAVVIARLIGAAIAIAAVTALAFVLPLKAEVREVTALSSLLLIPLALDTGWVYKGQGNTRKVGIALLMSEGATLVLLLVFVHHESHVMRVPAIQALGDLAAALFLAAPLLRGRWKLPGRAAILHLTRSSGMNTLSRSLRTIIVSFDIVILGLMVSSSQVGLYSAAYRIVFFVMAIMYAAHVAFLPEMAREENDPAKLSAILANALGLSMAAVIPFVVGGILIAPSLMSLVFGESYVGGAHVLQLLLGSILIISIHGTARNFFLVTRRNGLEAWIMAAGVVANITLNVLLIPPMGIAGAAIATIAGEAAILILTVVALARLGIRPGLRMTVAPILAGAALAAAILVFGTDRPAIQLLVVGGVAYFASLAVARSMVASWRRPLAAGVST